MKLPVPIAVFDQHIVVLGKTRSGKSSKMRVLAEDRLRRGLPTCIVDPKGDWYGIKLGVDGKSAGFPLVIFGGKHADVPINSHSGAAVAELWATGNRSCLIDLSGWMVSERTQFWIDFASTLFRTTTGERWLFVDEFHHFAPKGKVESPQAGKMLHWSNTLAAEGLGKGLHMVFASQRPQKVHNDCLTSAETLIACKVLHPADRNAVSDWIKGCGDARGDEVLATLSQLPRPEAWVWSPEADFGPVRQVFPMFTTYDSFKPQPAGSADKLKGWADVDLDEVRAKLGAVVAEAEANDPKKLRARIAELERAARAPQGKTAAVISAVPAGPRREDVATIKALRAELERAMKFIATIKTVGFPDKINAEKLESAIKAAMVQVGAQINRELDGQRRAFERWQADGETLRQRLEKLLGNETVPIEITVRHNEPFSVQAKPAAKAALSPPVPRAGGVPSGVSTPQQRILDELAALEALGIAQPNKTQLALWCEVSPTSGGYFNNLGSLRSAGLIEYPAGGEVALTDSGRSAAQAREPLTMDQMQDALCARLGNAKAAILRALIHQYPGDFSKDDLAKRIEVSPTSGGYFNNLGSLRSLGVIAYPAPGRVAALPVLFLEQ